MHVDLAAVVAEGRRRRTRRTASLGRRRSGGRRRRGRRGRGGRAVPHGPAAPRHRRAAPRGDRGSHRRPGRDPRAGSHGGSRRSPDLSGSATLTAPGGSYAVSVADGLLTVAVTRDGGEAEPVKAALRGRRRRLAGGRRDDRLPCRRRRRPGGRHAITYLPLDGAAVLPHQVSTAAAGDFTAYLITFTDPPATATVAADVGLDASPAARPGSWTLAVEGQQPESIGVRGRAWPARRPPR